MDSGGKDFASMGDALQRGGKKERAWPRSSASLAASFLKTSTSDRIAEVSEAISEETSVT